MHNFLVEIIIQLANNNGIPNYESVYHIIYYLFSEDF